MTASLVSRLLPTLPHGAPARRLHRLVSWVGALAVLCFALTGLLHPLMARLQPRPAHAGPPALPPPAAPLASPASVLIGSGVRSTDELRLWHDGTRYVWRVQALGAVGYFDASSGRPLPATTEAQHAERLARWYAGPAGDAARVVSVDKIGAFGGDYAYVNRVLPVWQVRLDTPDALVVTVSTVDDRLAALSNGPGRLYQAVFRAVHTAAWLPWGLRQAWLWTLLAGLVLTVLAGLWLALHRGPRRVNLRRGHRWGGVLVAGAVLAWAGSGFWQSLGMARREDATPETWRAPVAIAMLTAPVAAPPDLPAGSGLPRLVVAEGRVYWRWAPPGAGHGVVGQGLALAGRTHDMPGMNRGGHVEHGDPGLGVGAPAAPVFTRADDPSSPGAVDAGATEAARLRTVVKGFGLDPRLAARATPVTGFDDEYGFINKRLPVWRVPVPGQGAWFFETSSGGLAARVLPADRRDDWLFAVFHKWEFLARPFGKTARDVATSLAALLLVGVTLGGMALRDQGRWWPGGRRARPAPPV